MIRDGRALLAASRYPNHAQPLWNLPGGRQRGTELLEATVRREFAEETGVQATPRELLFVSESFDREGAVHVLSATFAVDAAGEAQTPRDDAHIVALAWVPLEELATYLSVAVVREPLLAHLRGEPRRYYGFAEAGVTIRFADEP